MSDLPADTTHRPWPVPSTPWVMAMRWNDLAFLHWPVDHAALRPLVPASLELETHAGRAWIGITPFHMSHVRARITPAVPGFSAFPELNVRTYVSAGAKPGVWFFSLDAASALAVLGARCVFGLPYFAASMRISPEGERIRYRCVRSGTGRTDISFRGSYQSSGPTFHAEPGTLEHWLTERYCLYSLKGGRLYRGEIHHGPWPLQAASVEIANNTMTDPIGIDLGHPPPLVHFARRLDVVAWLPSRVTGAGRQRA